MAYEEETIESIEDAIESVAKGMVSSSSENGRSMSTVPIKDLIEADRYLKGKTAATKPRFTKCIPPGGG